MKHIFEIALKTFEHIEIEKRFLAKKVLQNWPKIVGHLLEHKVYPINYWENTLYIHVSDGIWKQEILLRKDKILNDLNSFYPKENLFKELKITFNSNKNHFIDFT